MICNDERTLAAVVGDDLQYQHQIFSQAFCSLVAQAVRGRSLCGEKSYISIPGLILERQSLNNRGGERNLCLPEYSTYKRRLNNTEQTLIGAHAQLFDKSDPFERIMQSRSK